MSTHDTEQSVLFSTLTTKPVHVAFDEEQMSSDGGGLLLKAVDDRLGLTEALALRDAALKEGYEIMVGCMVGSSLAMAPAVLVAQGAMITDLDGPLLLAQDREHALRFDEKGVHPSDPALWG